MPEGKKIHARRTLNNLLCKYGDGSRQQADALLTCCYCWMNGPKLAVGLCSTLIRPAAEIPVTANPLIKPHSAVSEMQRG